jgi:hypothetical protein
MVQILKNILIVAVFLVLMIPLFTYAQTKIFPSQIYSLGVIDAWAPVTVTNTTSCNLGVASGCATTAYQSGYTFNGEATLAQAVTYNLPTTINPGAQYCVKNGYNAGADTGTLEIKANTSQFIIFTDGTLTASAGFVQSGGAAVDAACVVGYDSTHWMLYVQSGTWTEH